MNTIWYKTWMGRVEEVEVFKETEKCVFVKGSGKCLKMSDSWQFHKTKGDAVLYLRDEILRDMNRHKESLEYQENKLSKLRDKYPEILCKEDEDDE